MHWKYFQQCEKFYLKKIISEALKKVIFLLMDISQGCPEKQNQ